MKLLFNTDASIEKLKALISKNAVGDYIYMYPPRQAYNRLDPKTAYGLVTESLNRFSNLNLYFHFPFCKQICSFCNLYTKVSKNKEEYAGYVKLLISELKMYEHLLYGKEINTIYIGGGTPSLLDPRDINSLLSYLEVKKICEIGKVPEVAMEVAPDTVEYSKFMELKDIGINRVNLGFQAANLTELESIGRTHGVSTLSNSFEVIKKIGFSNVCIDLIYGLQNQTFETWKNSIEFVINYNPETICIYPLTLRLNTPYNKKGYTYIDGEIQSKKYDFAVNAFHKAGYKQETHIRFIKENGGYLQKENHWRMQNILGIGAGARSYLWDCDTRNNYGTITREKAYRHYTDSITNNQIPITDGYLMTRDERMRKAIILNLISLDRGWFVGLFGEDILTFSPNIYALEILGFLIISDTKIELTPMGLKHRDLIVQLFFSKDVIDRTTNYLYKD